jgi:hypothetical protein
VKGNGLGQIGGFLSIIAGMSLKTLSGCPAKRRVKYLEESKLGSCKETFLKYGVNYRMTMIGLGAETRIRSQDSPC